MPTMTFGQALDKIGATLPGHLVADAEVPILLTPQPQGDLMIIPAADDDFNIEHVTLVPVPDDGIQVVTGEATGNTHWLQRNFNSPGVTWGRVTNHELVECVVHVPEGESAVLIHTDEHGANAMGPGDYVIRGKREMADQIRRVAD